MYVRCAPARALRLSGARRGRSGRSSIREETRREQYDQRSNGKVKQHHRADDRISETLWLSERIA